MKKISRTITTFHVKGVTVKLDPKTKLPVPAESLECDVRGGRDLTPENGAKFLRMQFNVPKESPIIVTDISKVDRVFFMPLSDFLAMATEELPKTEGEKPVDPVNEFDPESPDSPEL